MSRALTRLSARLDERFAPVVEGIAAAATALREPGGGGEARAAAAALEELGEALAVLSAKVAARHSYVLLFGPLKSGKSTLMNALSAAYVSEVTSLPAYPCMVYVGHGDAIEVSTTRWDGSTERSRDLGSIRGQLALAHGELARALRDVEVRGVEFDPAAHLPQAIRRIDVQLPAPELRESGTMLVDTPGLYTRMKFGYDHLTREFKLASASAIFVVKTDNLFLEQVFAEFDDLLRLFTRIFLVVNLDTAKRDLEPGGELEPSLERRDPGQILAAFEELAMGPTMRRARDEGRLSIYPIDLLQAASTRLRGPATGTGDAAEAGRATNATLAFERFRGDLNAYLSSHEALVAFVHDTLRQAGETLAAVSGTAGGAGVEAAAAMLSAAETERLRHAARGDAAARLRDVRLEAGLEPLRENVASVARETASEARRRVGELADEAIDRWFDSDRSFAALVEEDLAAVLDACRGDLATVARDAARTVLGSDLAAAGVRRTAETDFALVDLPLAGILRDGAAGTEPRAVGRTGLLRIPTGLVPVSRGLLDWILLRGPLRMRRALFGPEEAPHRAVPRAVKQRRLGAAARAALGSAVRVRLDRFFADALGQSAVSAFGSVSTDALARLRGELDRARIAAARAVEESQDAAARAAGLRLALEGLARRAGEAAGSIGDLAAEAGVARAAAVPGSGGAASGAGSGIPRGPSN